jgi:hypothetical protein
MCRRDRREDVSWRLTPAPTCAPTPADDVELSLRITERMNQLHCQNPLSVNVWQWSHGVLVLIYR